MKNHFIKIIFLSFLLIVINSCAITQSLWVSRPVGLTAEGFFIDKSNNKIILVSRIDQTKPNTHYAIENKNGNLVKIFEIAQKSGTVIHLLMTDLEARGPKVFGSIFVTFKMKNLSKEDINFLNEFNLHPKKTEGYFSDHRLINNADPKYWLMNTVRYHSSEETFTNFCSNTNKSSNCIVITKFSEPYSGVMWEKYTTSEKIVRGAATPFTIVADIILAPLYLIGFIGMGVGSK